MLAPFRFVGSFVSAKARMIAEVSYDFVEEFFVATVSWFDAGGFAKIQPAMQAVFSGGIFEVLFLFKAGFAPGLFRPEPDESRSCVREFRERLFAIRRFSVSRRSRCESDHEYFLAVNFQNTVGVNDGFIGRRREGGDQ